MSIRIQITHTREQYLALNSRYLRKTPDLSEWIPPTPEEIEDEKIMLDYERELLEKQKSRP